MYNNRLNLIEYIPQVLQDVEEYKAVLDGGEQEEINTLWQSLGNTLNNQFILNATQEGIARYENMLGVKPKATETLDERKFSILAKFNEELPFTMRMLQAKLEMLCGKDYIAILIPEEYVLTIGLGVEGMSKYNAVEQLVKNIVPANMVVNISEMYNRHSVLHQFTYGELEEYTHYKLRNEVF